MFLTLIIIGLTGLVMMAIPAFARHGHAPPPHGHAGGNLLGHGGHAGGAHAGAAHAHATTSRELVPAADDAPAGIIRFIPSPRAVFSVLALYGAFGNALVHAAHLSVLIAALLAVLPTLIVERFVINPIWNLVFRFQAPPSSPLEQLLFTEARAVTPFRNGKGLVSTVRDGRMVQLSARLREDQAALPVKVGEPLRIEEVDTENERLTVSVRRD